MSEEFVSRNLAGAVFRDVNLGEASFHDVNLAGARFEDINLSGARIRNASLNAVEIWDTDIRGLKIHGFDVEALIEAELDRRHPERLQLRIEDPLDPVIQRKARRSLAEHRTRVLAEFQAADPALLLLRPTELRWSCLEHLRHLLFAEEMYLRRWIEGRDVQLNEMGLKAAFLEKDERFAQVGSRVTHRLDEVLAAWLPVVDGLDEVCRNADRDALASELPAQDFGQRSLGVLLRGQLQHQWLHLQLAREALASARDTRGGA